MLPEIGNVSVVGEVSSVNCAVENDFASGELSYCFYLCTFEK